MKMKFFDLARKLAKCSNHPKCKLGAVIVRKNRVISMGVNKLKTHPRSNNKYKTLHAEIAAIISADRKDLRGADIYVYRENIYGLAMAKPCESCMLAIQEAGIKNIYYTTYGGYKHELG